MFYKIAEMTEEELEKIYELTYKYGWLTSEQRKEGWLPDKAYMEKAKIEGDLDPWINYGLEELSNTYENWLVFHNEEGWIETMMETGYENLEGPYEQMANWTAAKTATMSEDEMEDKFIRAVWEYEGGQERFLGGEDLNDLYETEGGPFIRQYLDAIEDDEKEERLVGDWEKKLEDYGEEEGAGAFILDNNLEEEFDAYLRDNIGYGDFDWFKELYYNIPQISEVFSSTLMDEGAFFSKLYRLYLENFQGLEQEIQEINKVNADIESGMGGSLQDKIILFQLGLTTAHHHGTMSDHLLETKPGEGKAILDTLASGPKQNEWNSDLKQSLGYDPAAQMGISPPQMTYYEPELGRHLSNAIAQLESSLRGELERSRSRLATAIQGVFDDSLAKGTVEYPSEALVVALRGAIERGISRGHFLEDVPEEAVVGVFTDEEGYVIRLHPEAEKEGKQFLAGKLDDLLILPEDIEIFDLKWGESELKERYVEKSVSDWIDEVEGA